MPFTEEGNTWCQEGYANHGLGRRYHRVQAAEDHYAAEMRAASDIQRIFRGALCRFRYERVRRAIELIQRVYRGFVTRCEVQALRWAEQARRLKDQQLAFFNAQAESIQRVFKGFWSRRYLHDFYAMKRYLLEVVERGERSRTYLQEVADAHLKEQLEESARAQELAIQKTLSECGHLVSTISCPGVYNSPYAKSQPHVLGEVQPKQAPQGDVTPDSVGFVVAREALPCYGIQAYEKFLLSTATANVGRQQAIQGPFKTSRQIALLNSRAATNFRSLTSSVRYDKVDKEVRMQKRIAKMTYKGPGFRVMKTHVSRPGPTVQADSLYTAPVEFRSDYTELPKIPGKVQFLTAVESGKSFQDYTAELAQQEVTSEVPRLPPLTPKA
ncbi:conserved hypothetical protein [Perkinsus marinus ATCC 50983]|uniref:Uncharacterized protein n=1 Tax=Perkinsus marinus (strain ATCC 50983 / TXsc) TaxID=423536 RepID=C5K7W1_PERM5|nr:conserved hypothetical protein [Perkinsus marinus ATCC 50983]EER19646.1 conserved hypothetical protein [Perkinsus marinus ATCC 50983]|eukprot:XP_002787850.1 conserved hypothetical protein [Perkinsus marinus ATCC 50983]